MATAKTRLQITLAPDIGPAIKLLAKRDRVPAATKAAELLRQAIEMEEDLYLSKIADERLKGRVRWVKDSDKIWG
ncbi:hypothetical protein A3C21_00410 [Candidatus Kaiserbacteria bacterium RIFCSPHIGHO2_02_FULL_59_21]|uniref:Antitoxin, RHH family protein n=1 Tax=Candidatus Kaiserbacteria bacterium RIFCSPHIGHO2_02_FULL_59_21 TaxID=1798500 RepID=A0A1F6E1P4_9BACT|nr:MAG: hypothetical protein A3C21_00410 [Candidatus Kaiserbacteria bacterium RIFCSPHIGHO2_02_FULL_59_21]OGG86302.1 MAG: hypothetical protein A3I47_03970 [Candidatus Kaiserbacteria bacterium RIFCSPLOWO2_02_FULL_59_19]